MIVQPPAPSLVHARATIRAIPFVDEAQVARDRIEAADVGAKARAAMSARAVSLVERMRAAGAVNMMESMLAEYGLSTEEGVSLMCLAEAYLRVPDALTIDALIKDKIGGRDWAEHAGESGSMLVNASTWGLMLTGELYDESWAEESLLGSVRRMVRRVGEPVVRASVAQCMKIMGAQFVLGRTIEEALKRGEDMMAKGYSYSFDMLGEGAKTTEDGTRHFRSYAQAIAAIGARAKHADPHANPGISVKLSALHPRYETVNRERVMAELVPRLSALAEMAAAQNIGLTVDAEEADRLDLSLSVMETALRNPNLANWDGFGIVVQAYAKTALPVIDWIIALASDLDRKIAVRLVKGAYWDAEIKNAQVLGQPTYPVFTRKVTTDVSYMACARRMLEAGDRLYPMFASHNAQTTAAILEMATPESRFEFQRLHGMGDSLHELLRKDAGKPCRIYAPVGVHKDLLAYLVRRLLENGANSSFVNRVMDEAVPPADLAQDPVEAARALPSLPHPGIPLPPALFGAERANSKGWNLNTPAMADDLDAAMAPFKDATWTAAPLVGATPSPKGMEPVTNPANRAEVVGHVAWASAEDADKALSLAVEAFPAWRDTPVTNRAATLDRIADLYEANTAELCAILTREAGKTRLDGVLEVREAVDFLRYYAAQIRKTVADSDRQGRGPFVCISPWNFPLAIFTGQIAAALAAGNTVVAKPAEQTPLIAHAAVLLMREAGLPDAVLALLPGDGATVGAALTGDPRSAGVCFTGSTETAILIDRAQAKAGNGAAPLVAETGGLNAMIVDSTALPEHAVRDIVNGAFQSAGQRCSALRALFIQDDIAAPLLHMLEGAMKELKVGNPWDPAVDVGPVIDTEARITICDHCATLTKAGKLRFAHPMKGVPVSGDFVAPTAFDLSDFAELKREIFGPILHIIRFKNRDLDKVVDTINAAGYGLTLGVHSRVDAHVERICRRAKVGNIYVNRNQIGAVVGVQPFGGEGLSGTGPKAGGPAYLSRFTTTRDPLVTPPVEVAPVHMTVKAEAPVPAAEGAHALAEGWSAHPDRLAVLRAALPVLPIGLQDTARWAIDRAEDAGLAAPTEDLPGPTGESNRLSRHGRGLALCLGSGANGLPASLTQAVAALAAGNPVLMMGKGAVHAAPLDAALASAGAPKGLVRAIDAPDREAVAATLPHLGLVVVEDYKSSVALRRALAARDGARIPLIALSDGWERFQVERVVSIDTTASGGNASLLTLAEG
ncbi:MAG: bifunctional proline dehydrogenase/L-glutamate gamma-semialdehyde dehydrogenase PutA [Rhodospirillum sp.]|nr:bifunctional proline dehydrogenase/L-glutamate gamma-semialdehyde dehydrogenase PutA [Rhodospirillum sp.]MCF8490439.1 bifunctional proline dehydrogenase/L-glutamate gamma-semialdehyde dehydrogenase PutA [Rhodospirillum sp.]